MKKLIVLSMLLVLSLVVAACGPSDSPDGTIGEEPGAFAQTPGALDETPPAFATAEATLPGQAGEGTPGEAGQATAPATPEPQAGAGTPAATDAVGTPAATEAAGTPQAGTGQAGTPGVPVTGVMAPTSHLSTLLDYTVVDMQGEEVGQVEDMVIDISNEVVLYLIVALDGDTPQRMVAVPYYRLDIPRGMEGDTQEITLRFESDLLDNAPDFDVAMVDFSDDSWNTSIETYWESPEATATPEPTEEAAETEEAEATPPATAEATPEAPAATTTPVSFVMATNLLDAEVADEVEAGEGQTAAVTDPIGDPVGTVAEVIIDPVSGRLQYLVVQAAGQAGGSEMWFPVPLFRVTALREVDDVLAEDVTVVVSADQLTAAPSFEVNALPDTNELDWDMGVREYWQQQ